MERDPRIQFGANLRSRRLALGLSQEEFAEKADLHWTYIGGIERGEPQPGTAEHRQSRTRSEDHS